MGAVYEARDNRLGRNVALKFIRGGDPELTVRLAREARAQARIEHENVCKVYEVNEIQGKAYIAMQLVEGESLARAAKHMSLDEKVIAMRDITRALHAAHTLGILHRDIKPSNIMVEVTEDGRNKPVVMDFGLARDEDANRGMTETGMIVGTPAYMSPEQARGERTIDRRSDVYSLGATLYELLCGVPPFEAESAMKIVMAVLSDEPIPLRTRNALLPEDLSTIAAKCLHKDPNERYESARALAADLDRYILGEPILGRRESVYRRFRRWAGKHRALVTTAFVAFVALGFVGGVAIRGQIRAAREKAALEAQAVVERELGQDIKEMEWFLRTAYMMPLHDVTLERKLIQQRIKQIDERRAGSGRIDALVDNAVGRGLLALGEYELAHERLSRACDSGMDTPELHYALGLVLGRRYQKAMERFRGATGDAWAQQEIKKVEAEYLTPALAAIEKSRGVRLDAPSYLEGLIAFYKKDYAAAVSLAEKAAQEAPWSSDGFALAAECHLSLGNLYKSRGEREPAQRELDEAVRLYGLASDLGRSDGLLYEGYAEAQIRRLELRGDFFMLTVESEIDATLEAAKRAAQTRPDRGTPYVKMASARAIGAGAMGRQGQASLAMFQAALLDLEHARTIDGDTFAIHQYSADYYWALAGNDLVIIEKAILEAKKAVEIDPKHPWGWLILSNALRSKGSYKINIGEEPTTQLLESIKDGLKAIELEDGHGHGWDAATWSCGIQAQWLASRGKDPRVELGPDCNLFDRCMHANPKGYCQENTGMMDVYIAEYEMLAQRNPSDTLRRAETNLETAKTIEKGSIENHALLVELRTLQLLDAFRRGVDVTPAQGALDKAILDCAQLSAKDPWCTMLDTRAFLLDADIAVAQHRPEKPLLEKAWKAATQAVESDARNSDAHQVLAEVERRLAAAEFGQDKHLQAGLDVCAKGIAINPNHPQMLLTCGQLHVLAAQREKDHVPHARTAQAMLEKARQLNPLLARETEKPLAETKRMNSEKDTSN